MRLRRVAAWLCGFLPCWLGILHQYQACAADNLPLKELNQQEVQKCREQMQHIHSAIVRFHDERKRLPRYLSELVPNYCHVQDLTCPAKDTVGNSDWAREKLKDETLRDPKCAACTYSYEFSEAFWRGTSLTYREYKNAQRDYLDLHGGKGRWVPIVRCFMHSPTKVINLTLDGQLTQSGSDWEEEFVRPDDALRPEALLPEIRIPLGTPLPPRPAEFGPDLVDITSHYNATLNGTWYEFPVVTVKGFDELPLTRNFRGSAKFDVRGVVQLKGTQMNRAFPWQCHGIKVSRLATRVHFLIGVYGQSALGQKIAHFRLSLRDQPAVLFDVVYGLDVLDWRTNPVEAAYSQIAEKVAWASKQAADGGKPEAIWLYDFAQALPTPNSEITSIDFGVNSEKQGRLPAAAPALFGITLEP